LSTGASPITYSWWLPDGSSSTLAEPTFAFSQSGVYGICLTITADSGFCTSVMCDTIVVDSSGLISTNPIWFDCLGVLWGPAMPGSPCDDGDPNTFGDAWTNNCTCAGMGQVDCLGIPGGPNQPGTPCTDSIPGGVITGTWDANCTCVGGASTLYVTGTIAGCNGSTLVNVQDWWTQPNLDTTFSTGANCNYVFAYDPTSPQFGYVTISYSCDGGLTWYTDSVNYSFSGAFTVQQNGNCQGALVDCLGVPGGSALPGTPCNDGNPMTYSDTWDNNCNCTGIPMSNCQADFTVQQTAPWQIATVNNSTGVPPIDHLWWLPDGSQSTATNPSFTFTQAGVYGICLTITADSGYCTSVMCDTVVVDSSGMINTNPVWYDCLGTLWGPNMPGTACTDSLPSGGTFSGVWSANCVCVSNGLTDCLGIPGGPNMPGTPCDDGNPVTSNDMWDANCNCTGSVNAPCQADFWVIQAYTTDSLLGPVPIPNELWLWNLSNGGSGTYSYLWDFGDGTTS
ncbi:MAG: PKD domain-containing protein, partial [Flavobacteriales bacterium]|nr:PKD domain-containing protein [Flavobacteriales bacterium]